MAPAEEKPSGKLRAFLLAAGVGSRLGELTKTTPKCLLPIGGRPLLDFWFDAFAAAGVIQVLINLHHHADQVRQYLNGKSREFRITTLFEKSLLGSAGTIRRAWDFVGDDENFLIVYADNFAEVDLRRLISFHRLKENPVLSAVAYTTNEPQRCGILELDSEPHSRSLQMSGRGRLLHPLDLIRR